MRVELLYERRLGIVVYHIVRYVVEHAPYGGQLRCLAVGEELVVDALQLIGERAE